MALVLPSAATAVAQTTLADLEDEVMCPICGTLLELAEAPQAQRQRAFISRMVAAGRSKDEIKDALVAQYGREVLALPEGSGFDLSAYLAPAIGFAVAAIALAIGVARWRRATRGSGPPGPGAGPRGDAAGPRGPASGPQGEDAERLAADLAKYDL